MCSSDLSWRVLLLCTLPLSACERPAPGDAAKTAIARDTVVQASSDTTRVSSKDTVPPDELPGDTVTTLVEDTAATEPRLEPVGTGYVLWMPTRMHEALQTMAPEFESFRRRDYDREIRQFLRLRELEIPLFGVVGDFDGDGRKDVVVHGASDSGAVIVAVLNERSGARAVEIAAGRSNTTPKRRLFNYLVHQRPGTIRSDWEDSPLQLRNDAFVFVYFEKAAVLYYYRGSRFVEYTVAD